MSLGRRDREGSKSERQEHQEDHEHQERLNRRDTVPPRRGGGGGGVAQTAGLTSGGRRTKSTAADFPVTDLRSSPLLGGRSRIAGCPDLEAGIPNPPPVPSPRDQLHRQRSPSRLLPPRPTSPPPSLPLLASTALAGSGLRSRDAKPASYWSDNLDTRLLLVESVT